MRSFSIYVHVPYCLHKCPYCDFNTYAVSTIPEGEYVGSLISELDYRGSHPDWRHREVRTMYFGGGTPSLFTPRSIRRIIEAVCALFPVHEQVEISLEANPGTVDADKLHGYVEAGVNRLSLGAQSFQAPLLEKLGRMHGARQIEEAVSAARAAGFLNVNLDLMYGIPTQTLEHLEADLRALESLKPEHVSAYGLTIEKGTPFYVSYKKGLLGDCAEEEVISMMDKIHSFLPERGYPQYEISNFAKPGKEARHNMAYWNGADYLGLGAGAHSFLGEFEGQRKVRGKRWANYAPPNRYMEEACARGCAQGWSDTLDTEGLIFEFFFLGLRKSAGVSLLQFEEYFGRRVYECYPTLLEVLSDQGLLRRENDRIFLTMRGLMLADSVIENFSKIERRAEAPRSVEHQLHG